MRGPVTLTRKLQLQEVTRQPDGAGGYTENWDVLGTLWADIRGCTGREREVTAATISYVPYRVIVRAAPVGSAARPRAGQRFVEGARVFRIEAVSDADAQGLYLACFTKEEVLT